MADARAYAVKRLKLTVTQNPESLLHWLFELRKKLEFSGQRSQYPKKMSF